MLFQLHSGLFHTCSIIQIKTEQRKIAGELVHQSLGKIVKILTSQLISIECKPRQIRQFDDFGRDGPYTKSRQNSEERAMVNWFTTLVFDVEIRHQDHWVKM